jgi:PAS domain S-box-containing protein
MSDIRGAKGELRLWHVPLLLALIHAPAAVVVAIVALTGHPQGSTIFLVGCLVWVGAANTTLMIWLVRSRRITRHAQRRQTHQQNLLSSVLDLATDGIFTCDASGNIRALNKSAVRLFGFPTEELLGQPLSRLLGQADRPISFHLVQANDQSVVGPSAQVDAVRKDGTRFPATVSLARIQSDDQGFFSVIVQDQTILREAGRLVEEASHAKSNFLVNVSHELRTPLSAILGLAELIRPSVPGESRHLDQLTHSAEVLLGLVDQLLDFAHLEAGEVTLDRALFSLRDVVQKVVHPLSEAAESRGLHLSVQVDSELPEMFIGDAVRLGQIVHHLVGNAIKFTAHGEVVVRLCEDAPSRRSPLAPTVVLLEVRDTGVGIPGNKLDQVFAPFEQADSSSTRRFGGVGLGLSTVSRLTSLMGGQVDVESHEACGTTFRTRLPLTAAIDCFAPSASQNAAFPPSGPAEQVDVLVVVADAHRGAEVQAILRQGGWLACQVNSGRQALLELYRGVIQGRPYPLLVIAQRLPDLPVEEVVRQHARITPEGFILLLTDSPLSPTAWPSGVDAVLPMNCSTEQLDAALDFSGCRSPRRIRSAIA